jgi:hypothetical protein
MLTTKLQPVAGISAGRSAFTLMEVVVSTVVAGVIFGGVLTAYIQSARFAEWTGYSLAAQALSIQELEQARSAKWDTQGTSQTDDDVDETGSIPGMSITVLDVPISGGNPVYATNYISISNVVIVPSPLIQVKFIRVDTVWSLRAELFTNTVAAYLAPDR